MQLRTLSSLTNIHSEHNIFVVALWEQQLAEEVQAVSGLGGADLDEVVGGECCELFVGEVGDGSEVFGLMF